MDRRQFLTSSTVLAGSALLSRVPGVAPEVTASSGSIADPAMIGIQAEAVSFVDEGTEKVLDNFQKQEYDTATFHGGNFATPHPQYYKDTALTPEKAPDLSPEQILAVTHDVMQYHDRPLGELAASGLGADYVLRETRRAIAGAGPTLKIWPGIDIDIPTAATSKKARRGTSDSRIEGGMNTHLVSRTLIGMKADDRLHTRQGR